MSPDDTSAARLLSADLAPPLGLDPRTCHIAEVARQVSMALRFLGLRLNLQCPQVTCQLYHSLSDPLGSVHPIRGDEIRALRKLRRGPITAHQRLGKAVKMPFLIHPHLRHACGFHCHQRWRVVVEKFACRTIPAA